MKPIDTILLILEDKVVTVFNKRAPKLRILAPRLRQDSTDTGKFSKELCTHRLLRCEPLLAAHGASAWGAPCEAGGHVVQGG